MRSKWLRWLAIMFFIGAIATMGVATVFGYVWYTYPDVVNSFLSTPTFQVSSQSFEDEISLALRTSTILTPVDEGAIGQSPVIDSNVSTITSTISPTITEQAFTITPSTTPTFGATLTTAQTATSAYPGVNTAIPYIPASTVIYPSLTNTMVPYYFATPAPSRTPTLAPTTFPTKTKTPTNSNIQPTVSIVKSATPTSTAAPTATSLPLKTATASQMVNSTPTYTFTPIPPTATISGPQPTPTVDLSGCSYSNHGYYENELLDYINTLRSDNGLSPLNMQSQLRGAAREHSTDMACNNFVSHTGSNGTTNHDRILAYGYSYSWRGENIYMGWNATPSVAFEWWINSEPHLDNLLNPNFIHIGIGHAVAGNRNAFTLVFGRP